MIVYDQANRLLAPKQLLPRKKRNFKVDIDLICERISRSDILTHILTTQSLLEMRILVTVTKFFMVIIETNRIIADRTDQYYKYKIMLRV